MGITSFPSNVDLEELRTTESRGKGLSSVHNRTSTDVLSTPAMCEFYRNGSLAKVKRLLHVSHKRPARPRRRATRGQISGFSRHSRKGLRETLGKIDQRSSPVIIWLTYPMAFPKDPQTYKSHRRRFIQKLKRQFGDVGVVWKLEFQRRGAPEFSFWAFGVECSDAFKAWVSSTWYGIVGSNDPKHLWSGTRVDKLGSWRGLTEYMCKPKIKCENEIGKTGRRWGVEGRKHIPQAELATIPLTDKEAFRLMRHFRRFAGIKARSYPSLSISLDANQWLEKLPQLIGQN